ncbi:MAG TPA: patatin-like phospholipase family protein [Vicinamibacterales bacterium]|nr:patatin-like phospholipase family protein [Vicinamibacterales bacterium]
MSEFEALEEEFELITVTPTDDEYRDACQRIDHAYTAMAEQLPGNPGRRHTDQPSEAAARLKREYETSRRLLFWDYLHRTGTKHAALCLSGGGIRSATFSLGVIQALAKRGLLGQFHYLSTVSGGGYIGSWLTAWIHRHPDGLTGVEREIVRGEPAPIFRLREYSRYLAPHFGFVTSDTWTLVTTYTRNLLITWFALFPVLAFMLAIPRLLVALVAAVPDPRIDFNSLWLDLMLLAMMVASIVMVVWMVGAMAVSLPGVVRGRSVIRTESHFVTRGVLPLALAGIFLTGCWRFVDAHPEVSTGLLQMPWPWFFSHDLRGWIGFGVGLHAIAVGPLVLWRFYDEYQTLVAASTRTFAQAFASVNSQEAAAAALRSAIASLDHIFAHSLPSLQRFGIAVIVCGGLGGYIMWLFAGMYAKFQTPGIGLVDLPLFVTFAPAMLWLGVLLAGTVYVAAVSPRSTDHEREWYARAGAWIVILISSWITLCLISFFGPTLVAKLGSQQTLSFAMVTISSIVVATITARASRAHAAKRPDQPEGWFAVLQQRAAAVAAPVMLVLVFSLVSAAVTVILQALPWIQAPPAAEGVFLGMRFTDGLGHLETLRSTTVIDVLLVLGTLLIIGALVNRQVDLGVFTLHAMYRDRLIRAYLAASRRRRRPNAFTGFDSEDNIPLAQLRPGLFVHADAEGLAQIVRDQFTLPAWSVTLIERRRASSDPDHIKRLVMELLADDNLDELLAIKRSPANQALAGGLEEVLVRRWNAVLVHPDLCRVAAEAPALQNDNSPTIDDPVLRSRRFLCTQPWFKGVGTCPRPKRLFPVINTALNLTRAENLAQHRKAEPFSMTPLHAGASTLRFSRLSWHARTKSHQDAVRYYAGHTGITLGTAMTISGAAANPNMGYHSSPVITLLLALFNARLGMWLPSPTDRDLASLRKPANAVPPIIREAFGVKSAGGGFVNLSDGGHFENLGLYEMVRRRCHTILVVDASQDQKYECDDLGNAISKIRVDFGVPIEFVDKLPFRQRGRLTESLPSGHGAVARIRYKEVDEKYENGWLLYIKPAIDGKEPVDVTSYADRHHQFPHEPTSNQFFGEMQFEAYRVLGAYSFDRLAAEAKTLENLVKRFERHHRRYASRTGDHGHDAGRREISA